MSGTIYPARQVTITLSHPAMHDKPFMPLVYRALREAEQHGPVVWPAEVDGDGNHVTRLTSTDGVSLVMRHAPQQRIES